jgi:membrane protein YdbS with pleckstrin-like domain
MNERLLQILRVPGRPDLTTDDPATIRVFNAAPAYLGYRRLSWALKQATALTGLIFGVLFLRGIPSLPFVGNGILLLEAAAWIGFVFQAFSSFLLLRLDWEQRWYLISDRSLRVRAGIVRMHEKTTTFANIQNISVHQGPLQRLFGIADLEVRSAGGGSSQKEENGGGGDDLHRAWLRGLADATALRDAILDRVRGAAGGGLGDPDEQILLSASTANSGEAALAEAADELLAQSRALFTSVSRPSTADDTE